MPSESVPFKILILIPNLGRGGAQQVFRQQLEYLSSYFETVGCVFNWEGAFPEERQKGIISLDIPAGTHAVSKAWYFLLRIRKLRLIKRRLGIRVTISHLEGADYINVLSKKYDKAICWVHGSKNFDQNIKGLIGSIRKRILIPYLYRKAEKLITVSREIGNELKTTFHIPGNKLVTIYNGLDSASVSRLQNQPVHPDFLKLKIAPVVITHCRLANQKNISGLLYVIAEVRKLRKVKLVVLGDGELRDELISLSRSLQLKTICMWENTFDAEGDVYFWGYTSNPYPYLTQSSLYIMTSNWEGFPLALCEAMACGKTVISTDCHSGPREILAPNFNQADRVATPYYTGYGILMPLLHSNDREQLKIWSTTLNTILDDKELMDKYGLAARNRVADFDFQKSMRATLAIINEHRS